MVRSKANPSVGETQTPRRSARVQSLTGASETAQTNITNATPSRGGASRRGRALPKVAPRGSQAYGSSARVGDVPAETAPVISGFAQALGEQLNNAFARDDEASDHRPTSQSSHSSEELDDVSPVNRAGLYSDSNAGETPTAAGDTTNLISPGNDATSILSSVGSKSFSIRHESGMVRRGPSIIPRSLRNGEPITPRIISGVRSQSNGAFTIPSTQRNGLAQAKSTSINYNGAGVRPTENIPVASASAYTTASRTRPITTSPGHGSTTSASPSQDRRGVLGNAWSTILDTITRKAKEGVSYVKTNSKIAMLLFFILAAALGIYFAPRNTLLGAVRARINYDWDKVRQRVDPIKSGQPLVPEIPDQPNTKGGTFDRKGRKAGEPGYDTLHDRQWNLEDALTATNARLDALLPSTVVVTRNQNSGFEVGEDFWRALASKMRTEGFTSIEETTDDQWKAFLSKNDARLTDYSNRKLEQLEVVSRKEMIAHMDERYKKLSVHVEQKLKEIRKNEPAGQISAAVADQLRLQALALAHSSEMFEVNWRKANYFAPGLGAQIDLQLTSSTFIQPSPPEWSYFKRFINSLFVYSGNRRPPVTAISNWNEPGDCWCAARDDKEKGLAQLAVIMPHEILPRSVTVEHLHRQAGVLSTSAPKMIELWVKTSEDLPVLDECGAWPNNHSPDWACLGRFQYEMSDNANHVQTFSLTRYTKKPVKHALIRVTENYGAPHTCLYRVRLHGDV